MGNVNLIHLLGSKSCDVGPDGSPACSSLKILCSGGCDGDELKLCFSFVLFKRKRFYNSAEVVLSSQKTKKKRIDNFQRFLPCVCRVCPSVSVR